MPTLKDYLNAHAGETAWIFGKGPSLALFDMAQAGPLRCAINDVAAYVPGCRYCFANDSVKAWAHVYQETHTLFQPLRLQHDIHAAKVPVPGPHVWFDDAADDERLIWPPERVAAEGLAIRHGTLGSAGQILRLMGVKKIVAVGIDGGGSHAPGHHWHTRLRADHARYYDEIRSAFIDACQRGGLELEFSHPTPDQNMNGTLTVKVTRACFIAGQPYEADAEVALPPILAKQMIAIGRATLVRPAQPSSAKASEGTPAKAEPETAEAAPAAETADLPAPKSKKTKK